MKSLLEFLFEHKEWIFSGIGVSIISLIHKTLIHKKTDNDTSINTSIEKNETLFPLVTIESKSITETQQIATRFNQFLDLLNQERKDFTIAKLAKIMELESVGELEKIFLNQKEPNFEFIQQFCKYFGINDEWLTEGKGQPFIQNKTPRYFSPYAYLEYFKDNEPAEIYFIKSDSKIGEVFFILKYTDWNYEIIQQQWHISSHVGASGSRQLYDMYRLINELRNVEFYATKCYGRILDSNVFISLYEGSTFPYSIIGKYYNNQWWDDLTDIYHKYPIAKNYSLWYGEEFIRAQDIIKSQIEMQSK